MSITKEIINKAGKKNRSGDWFRTQIIDSLKKVQTFDSDYSDTGGFAPGKMYFFSYDPKLKDQLPYYDAYPMVYVIEMTDNGFLGCNLHYVNPKYRDAIAISLLNNSAQGRVAVPPSTLHRYLYTGVSGIPYQIPKSEWESIVQLPTEKFVDKRGIVMPKHKIFSKA